jgi:hypothetical protein
MTEVCFWEADEPDSDMFRTTCGEYFVLNECGPKENGMKFCCFCGKPIKEEPATIEE